MSVIQTIFAPSNACKHYKQQKCATLGRSTSRRLTIAVHRVCTCVDSVVTKSNGTSLFSSTSGGKLMIHAAGRAVPVTTLRQRGNRSLVSAFSVELFLYWPSPLTRPVRRVKRLTSGQLTLPIRVGGRVAADPIVYTARLAAEPQRSGAISRRAAGLIGLNKAAPTGPGRP